MLKLTNAAFNGHQNTLGLTTPFTWSLAAESVDLMVDACSKEEVDNANSSLQPALASASPTTGSPLGVNGSVKGVVAISPLTLTFTADALPFNLCSSLSLGNVYVNRLLADRISHFCWECSWIRHQTEHVNFLHAYSWTTNVKRHYSKRIRRN